MDRRRFLQVSGGALAAGVAGNSAAAEKVVEPFAVTSAPVLLNASADSVQVTWAVKGLGTGWVEYGETEKLGMRADGVVAGMRPLSEKVISVALEGLKPGTRYFYRAHSCGVEFVGSYNVKRKEEVRGQTRSFRTLDSAAGEASFVVWNDTHENKETVTKLAGMLRERPADFLMWNGDVTNDIHREEQIVGQFLSPAGQAFAETTPVFIGRGNHDVRGRDARKLAEYVTGPDGRSYYYAFRQGPVAVIVMDTGEDKPDGAGVYAGLINFAKYREEQAKWLAGVMERPEIKGAPFKVVFAHIPLVWDGEVPERWLGVWGEGIKGWMCEDGYAKWNELLVKGGVDVVISGHTHRHAWFGPREGRPWGQLIGGGPTPGIATVMEGRADGKRMVIEVKRLEGEVLIRREFEARG